MSKQIDHKRLDFRSKKIIAPIEAGHMSYKRFIAESPNGEHYFYKVHAAELFSDSIRREDARQHLLKELAVYRHLKQQGYTYLPPHVDHDADTLILTAMTPSSGWSWEVLGNDRKKYITDTIQALNALEHIPIPVRHKTHQPTQQVFLREGWNELSHQNIVKITKDSIAKWQSRLHTNTLATAKNVVRGKHPRKVNRYKSAHRLNHHDARQSNIAWHPEHGIAIVDWSWSDEGFEKGDTTMFLIDILKSYGRVDDKLLAEYFNPEYAHMLFGHWLYRANQPVREGNEEVRFHQFVSAMVAAELLDRI